MNDTVIEVKDMVAGYEGRVILKDISFTVAQGETFVVLGGSGCGKSTLLKHLIGLHPLLSGEVRILGHRIQDGGEGEREAAMRSFGVTYQSGALFGSMTLLENVCLPLESFTDLPSDARRLIAEMKLELVGLKPFANYFPTDVSGGMKKRAAIARARGGRACSRPPSAGCRGRGPACSLRSDRASGGRRGASASR